MVSSIEIVKAEITEYKDHTVDSLPQHLKVDLLMGHLMELIEDKKASFHDHADYYA